VSRSYPTFMESFPVFRGKKKMSIQTSLAESSQTRIDRRLIAVPWKPSILIAEDSADSREMMHLLLEAKGYRVFEAENGIRALEVAVKNNPDAVLLDLTLPKLDGLTVTRNLRLHPNFKHVPIIIVSGHDPNSYRQKALDAGCDEYLLKPINFDRLQTMLNQMVPLERRAQAKFA